MLQKKKKCVPEMFFFHEAMDQLKTEIDKGLAYFKH